MPDFNTIGGPVSQAQQGGFPMVLLLRCLQVTGLLFGLCTAAHAALLVSGLGNVSGGSAVLQYNST